MPVVKIMDGVGITLDVVGEMYRYPDKQGDQTS